ncbi:MAG: acyl-[acyl-carrier-protein]--UDP-N-acetylglucosamine O-acyltransferase [Deltaproteobacteria bacterium RIFCSPLOWO2_02_56_12]|nr:MAG: acyl-[acyl-carrier-protein]--UDP-N-acetylglucosamine O-acyltransferase [Deltaproteobacteria bacterium GWD2_55_8]OGQ48808.1 MAG: acyl-[acyl-carrier-protein]--UDP-N-acetylglucosamine O-acyltransferase [Deltaproteobacteria bacterium RIFCSPLOWO2_02_56_12]OGQ73263.1 MAG: acyl-[acyl-carrier-protein]--UDP-N-acetylglucosamine O-acyltransferase [Deltaproteobacteria bacterium RIFCSPLOWO2_12_55_13]HBA40148.1 acyl-[acyl-carrier-protein]--UDP-N-acetylglucosamine O-acyltransferase [Deltaproteobacteria
MTKIHEKALVDARAELAADVEIGAYCVIGPKVKIGKGTRLKSHVVVEGNTTLGEGNVIFQFASVGSVPQDLKYRGEDSQLIIGDRNTIREFVSLNPGTAGGGMITRVGNHNLFMMYCHIAHDCVLGSHNIIANGATLGGHVVIEDYVIVGGLVGIHQFVRVGTSAILGAGSMVSKDIPPYCNATGDRAKLRGLNREGLRRKGFTGEQIATLKKAYRIIFQSGLRTKDALKEVKREFPESPEIERLVVFIERSQRGICR